jgi:hypothetical protein
MAGAAEAVTESVGLPLNMQVRRMPNVSCAANVGIVMNRFSTVLNSSNGVAAVTVDTNGRNYLLLSRHL